MAYHFNGYLQISEGSIWILLLRFNLANLILCEEVCGLTRYKDPKMGVITRGIVPLSGRKERK
jgi:hypothetical protein